MKIKTFYPYVTLFATIDLIVNTGLIWSSLQLTGSPLIIGLILSIATLVPFVFKQLMSRLDKRPRKLFSLRFAFLSRIVGYAVIGLTFMALSKVNVSMIILAAFISGIINFISLSHFETQNTLYVLQEQIHKKLAARVIETAIQIGACAGSFFGGVLIDYLSLPHFMTLVASLAIVFSLLALMGLPKPSTLSAAPAEKQQSATPAPCKPSRYDAWLVIIFALGLGIIGFHIGSFNILVPVVYQKINLWSASLLGSASAAAGAGAFLASLSPNSKRWVPLCGLLIAVSDGVVVFSKVAWISIGICFILGFCINYIRIAIRERLIHLSTDEHLAHRIASLSMFNYLFLRGLSPLLVSGLVSGYLFGIEHAALTFVIIGTLSGFMLILPFMLTLQRGQAAEVSHA